MGHPLTGVPWLGGKGKLLKFLYYYFPKCNCFVDVFGGGGSVILNRPDQHKKSLSVYNDKDHRIYNFFKVLRERPEELLDKLRLTSFSKKEFEESLTPPDDADEVELARLFFVRVWQCFPYQRSNEDSKGLWNYNGPEWKTTSIGYAVAPLKQKRAIEKLRIVADKLTDIQVECSDWSEMIDRYDHPLTFFYLDPPYTPDVRKGDMYVNEMSLEEHRKMGERLQNIKGKAMVSGYENDLYNEIFSHWRIIKKPISSQLVRAKRVECLWLSYDNAPPPETGLWFGE